jgi:hypothetical protein
MLDPRRRHHRGVRHGNQTCKVDTSVTNTNANFLALGVCLGIILLALMIKVSQ